MWVARRSAVTIVANGWARATARAASRSSSAKSSTMCMPARIPGPGDRSPTRLRSASFRRYAVREQPLNGHDPRTRPSRALHRARGRAPFEQLRFEDLPERPRVPHRYDDADTDDIVVASKPFGRIRVRVVSYGPPVAPPLLLVHGLMTSSYSWRYLFDELGDRFRLVAPDLPGAGRTEPAPDRRHRRASPRDVHRRAARRARPDRLRGRRQLARRLPLHAPRARRSGGVRAPRGHPSAGSSSSRASSRCTSRCASPASRRPSPASCATTRRAGRTATSTTATRR